jgi:hypothetical protein
MNFDRHPTRTANSHNIASQLAGDFIKKYGKKNVTRRHVLAFLQEEGQAFRQYLASEIIRCLKLNHKVYIEDVMDKFPVAKTASFLAIEPTTDFRFPPSAQTTQLSELQEIHGRLVDLHTNFAHDKRTSEILFKCATNVARLMGKVN